MPLETVPSPNARDMQCYKSSKLVNVTSCAARAHTLRNCVVLLKSQHLLWAYESTGHLLWVRNHSTYYERLTTAPSVHIKPKQPVDLMGPAWQEVAEEESLLECAREEMIWSIRVFRISPVVRGVLVTMVFHTCTAAWRTV